MDYGKRLGRYERTRIETAGKVDLIVMCYEKILQSIHQAEAYYAEKEYEKKSIAMQRAMNIINELQCSLDFKKGGQIAENLDRIYSYVTKKLLMWDMKRDIQGLNETLRLINELKGAWEGISAKNEGGIDSVTMPKDYRPRDIHAA